MYRAGEKVLRDENMAHSQSPSLRIVAVEIRDIWEKKLHLHVCKWRLEDTAKRNSRFGVELEMLW